MTEINGFRPTCIIIDELTEEEVPEYLFQLSVKENNEVDLRLLENI